MAQHLDPASRDGAGGAPNDNIPVPLLDLARAHHPLRDELIAALTAVVDSGQFLFGPDVKRLENDLAAYCGARHGVSCASGSDALLLALMAREIGPGDEVIAPSFTFFATASAAWRLGAKPVFVDIDPITFNVDPAAVEAAITRRARAIIPVHLFGQCADMSSLGAIARRHELYLVEDVAQAIGASLAPTEGGGKASRAAGAIGDVGCFSFYPTKNLGGFGDGGLLTTSDDALADRLRLLAGHGMRPRYYHSKVGINSRLDSLQAAALNVKFQKLPAWTEARRRIAGHYGRLLADARLHDLVTPPVESPNRWHVWNQYTIRVNDGQRDALREHLKQRRIHCEVYYPVPLHLQECFQPLNYTRGALPETERAADEVLSLPIYPGLSLAEQEAVVEGIAAFQRARRPAAPIPSPKFKTREAAPDRARN